MLKFNRELKIIFVLYFIFSICVIIQNKPIGDERDFHYPTAINFFQHPYLKVIYSDLYKSANTPLPYIISSILFFITGPSLIISRLLTVIISLLTILMVSKYLNKFYKLNSFYVLPLFFYPYYLMNSFVFYTPVYGLFFFTLFLYNFSLNNSENQNPIKLGLFLLLAASSQQFYLVIPLGIFIFLVYRQIKVKFNLQFLLNPIKNTALITLPILLLLIIFIPWGGLVHPNFHVHKLSFQLSNFNAITVVIGFTFFIFFYQIRNQISKFIYLSAFIIALVLSFNQPHFSHNQAAGNFTGIIFHLISLMKVQFFVSLFNFLFSFLGISIIIYLTNSSLSKINHEVFLIISIFFLGGGVAFNELIGEKHAISIIFLLFLLIIPKLDFKYFIIKTIYFIILGTIYFFYFLFYKHA